MRTPSAALSVSKIFIIHKACMTPYPRLYQFVSVIPSPMTVLILSVDALGRVPVIPYNVSPTPFIASETSLVSSPSPLSRRRRPLTAQILIGSPSSASRRQINCLSLHVLYLVLLCFCCRRRPHLYGGLRLSTHVDVLSLNCLDYVFVRFRRYCLDFAVLFVLSFFLFMVL